MVREAWRVLNEVPLSIEKLRAHAPLNGSSCGVWPGIMVRLSADRRLIAPDAAVFRRFPPCRFPLPRFRNGCLLSRYHVFYSLIRNNMPMKL